MNQLLPSPLLDFALRRQLISSICSSFSSSTIAEVFSPPAPINAKPLPSLFPRHLNPHCLVVDLFCSKLRQHNQHCRRPDTLCAIVEDDKETHRLLPYLHHQEISKILLRSQSLPLPSLSFFQWAKNNLEFSPNVENYCIIVHILTSSRLLLPAIEILSDLIQTHPKDDVFASLISSSDDCEWDPPTVFGLLIKVYIDASRVANALETCQKTLGMGFTPDARSINRLLNALVNLRVFDVCWNVYKDMRRAGISPNPHTFNIMTRAICLGDGGAGEAVEFMEEMEIEGFDPDIVTYNTLVDGYCRKGRINDALYLFEIMYKRRVTPDVVTHTCLMNGLCREGRVREAHKLFKNMIEKGLCPDVISYNVLLAGYFNVGRTKESRCLLQQMSQHGLIPNDSTAAVLIRGYVKCGRLLPCLNAMGLLRKLGTVVSHENYCLLVEALCMQRRPNVAKSLLDWMIQDGHQPSSQLYRSVLISFCECDSIDEAIDLKSRWDAKAARPDLVVYNALIGCLCRLGRTSDGVSMLEEMVGFGLLPSSVMCAALVGGYCKERSLDKAESVLYYFAVKFRIYDIDSFNFVIRGHCESDISKAFGFHDKMLRLGFVPNRITCKHLIERLSANSTMSLVTSVCQN